MPANSNEFIRNLFAYFGFPFTATPVSFNSDFAVVANTWTKVNVLSVNPPPTHDSVPVVDPVPNQFIDFSLPADPDLSKGGWVVWLSGQLFIQNDTATAATVYITFDQNGFGDMAVWPLEASVTKTVPFALNASVNPLGSNLSLWVRATQNIHIRTSQPIADHTGGLNSSFVTRMTLFTYPNAH